MPTSQLDGLPSDLIRQLHPISEMSGDGWKSVLPICHVFECTQGSDPIQGGYRDTHVLYLVAGELRIDAKLGAVDVLVGGKGRALWPFLSAANQPVRSKAITDVVVLAVVKDALDILMTWGQVAEQSAEGDHSGPKDWRQMSGMFAAHNLTQGAFAALPSAHIAALLDRFKRIPVSKGEVIVRQGAVGDYYYLIERGRCRVTREVGGAVMDLADLREGDSFGEEALLADAARNATVTMRSDGALLRLSKDDFNALLRAPLLQALDFGAASERVAQGALWIDVRFPAEFHEDGLPGAINLPLNEIRKASTLLDPGKEYIVYCQSGRRSAAAAFLLSQRGMRAWLLSGGLAALN